MFHLHAFRRPVKNHSAACGARREEGGVMSSPVKDKKPALLPVPNSDFYCLIETLPAEELVVLKRGAHFHGDENRAHHHQVLGRRCFLIRNLARSERTQYWRDCYARLGPQKAKCAALWFDRNGDGALRFVDCDIFGVHNGLAMGSIYLGGSEEQKQKWLPHGSLGKKLAASA
jgi:hypothetical protein